MKRITIIILLVVALIAALWWIFKKHENHKTEEQATILLEKISEVKKLMLVEGTFSEVYTYKEADKIFYGLWPVEKKVIVMVNAKASVGYDMAKVNYTIDKDKKQVIIGKLPEQEIMIEPEIKYFDIQESQFYQLTADDLSKINKQAVALIRKQVDNSTLPGIAEERLDDVLAELVFMSKDMGWEVIKD